MSLYGEVHGQLLTSEVKPYDPSNCPPELLGEFSEVYGKLVRDGFVDQAMLRTPSDFVQNRRWRHDGHIRQIIQPALEPFCPIVQRKLSTALDDGGPTYLVQDRFHGIDPLSEKPIISTSPYVKYRTMHDVEEDAQPVTSDEKGTNSEAEKERTPELAQQFRHERIDETPALWIERLSLAGIRQQETEDVMHMAVRTIEAGPRYERNDHYLAVAQWLVAQTRSGHGATSESALAFAGRSSNAGMDYAGWLWGEKDAEQMTVTDYYSLLFRTGMFVGNAIGTDAAQKYAMPHLKEIAKEAGRMAAREAAVAATGAVFGYARQTVRGR